MMMVGSNDVVVEVMMVQFCKPTVASSYRFGLSLVSFLFFKKIPQMKRRPDADAALKPLQMA